MGENIADKHVQSSGGEKTWRDQGHVSQSVLKGGEPGDGGREVKKGQIMQGLIGHVKDF